MIINCSIILIGCAWLSLFSLTRLNSKNLLKLLLSFLCGFFVSLDIFFLLSISGLIKNVTSFVFNVVKKLSFQIININPTSFTKLGVLLLFFILGTIAFYWVMHVFLKNIVLEKKVWKYILIIFNLLILILFFILFILFLNYLYHMDYGILGFIFDSISKGILYL